MTRLDYVCFGLAVGGAGAGLCALKAAGWGLLAGVPYWQLAAGPALALALEFVLLAGWLFGAGFARSGGRKK